jgi:DNA-binding CsgD family transcriptional regulator
MFPTMVLTFLIALATGFMSLALVSRRSHHHYSPVADALVPPLLFYNLWILLRLTYRFLEASMLGEPSPAMGRGVILALSCLSVALAIHLGSSYLAFILRTTRPAFSPKSLRSTWRAASLLSAGAAAIYLALFAMDQEPLIRLLNRILVSLTFLTMALLSLWFILGTHPVQERAAWRNIRLLGAAYSVIFLTLTLFIGWYRYSAAVHPYTYVTITVAFGVVYNLVTVSWIHFFDPILQVPEAPMKEATPMKLAGDPLAGAYGISKREGEVIQLVCRGLTNQEIADALFISLKTVKDHNYRIFQKTGVRNRVELVQLVQKLTVEEGRSLASRTPSPASAL